MLLAVVDELDVDGVGVRHLPVVGVEQIEGRDRQGMVGHETAHGRREQVRAEAFPPLRPAMDGLRGASDRDDGQMPPATDELHFDLHRPCSTTRRVHRSLR